MQFNTTDAYRCVAVTEYAGFDWHDWSETTYLLQDGANLASLSKEELLAAFVNECCNDTALTAQLMKQILAGKESGSAENEEQYYCFSEENGRFKIELNVRGYTISWTFKVVDMETPKWIPIISYSCWPKMSPSCDRLFTEEIYDRYEDAKAFNDRLVEEHSEILKNGPYYSMKPVVIPYTESTISAEWRNNNLTLLRHPDFWEKYTQVIKFHSCELNLGG